MSTHDTDDFRCINNSFTTSYKYPSADQEFIFTCKGRPFAAMVYSNFPLPTSNLLDYDLVQKLGLKMTDIQCRKFHFHGNKFRILGRVSTAVQCVQDGRISGNNYHIKGFVVSDLNQLLDTHCVAGNRMKQFLLQHTSTTAPGGRDHVPPAPGGRDHDPQALGGRDHGPQARGGQDHDPQAPDVMRHEWMFKPEAWPGGVGSNMKIPWCHPEANKVPWLVDEAVSSRIMYVNGIPSHYARVACVKCNTNIEQDTVSCEETTRDPEIQRCTSCWIDKEIRRRKKMK